MAEIINQCCYTHIGAWTTVAQKGDFDQKYIGELSRHATLPGNEYGKDLAVYETVGDGDKFLIMRTQYGLRDLSTESGRASMFSHGYLMDTSGEIFDPNVFLTVSKENFCTNETDASKNRTSLQRTENFTLKSAIAASGLTMESFSKLIKCVYQLSVRSVNKQALFIKAKDEEQSLALLYCIYSALIPRYSKFLSSASTEYNFSDMRNIVFTKSINTARKYFVPETGENNVLSVNVEKNIDSLYFVDYGVKNFSTTEAIQEYYSEFEKTLKKISDGKQVDDEVIRLSHVMTADPVPSKESDVVSDDNALISILNFAEEFNEEKQNEFIKEYIEKLREEAIIRGLISREPLESDNSDYQPITNIIYGKDGDIYFNQGVEPKGSSDAAEDISIKPGSSDILDEFERIKNKYAPVKNVRPASVTQNINRPFSDSEKNSFKRSLINHAKKGIGNYSNFKRIVDEVVVNNRVQLDVNSKNEFAEIIYDGLCEMFCTNMQDEDAAFIDNPLVIFKEWCEKLHLSDSDIKNYQKNLILFYWSAFSWSNFSDKKITEYRMFMISKSEYSQFETEERLISKSHNANSIAELMVSQKSFTADKWLSDLNDSCNGNFSTEDGEFLRKILIPFYTKKITTSKKKANIYFDNICTNHLISFAIYFKKAEFCKFVDTWQHIYQFLNTDPNKRKRKEAEAITEAIKEVASINYNKRINYNATYNFFCNLETRKIEIPFDFWLAFGSINTEQPFKVFYGKNEPLVKSESPSEIVSTSFLLKDDFYVKFLNEAAKETKDKFIRKLAKAVSGDDIGGVGKKIKSLFQPKKQS